ncbi:LytR/AlgR family response regulator transcription factor [Ascidiimonas sp. W6]|uniref:LytR/AlgR family response regulator transcription factor n=1 Tax=Ascidiimonas meishanensis TaxID=3128903 RepID=UPI0030EEC3F1
MIRDQDKVLIRTKKGIYVRPMQHIMYILAEGSYSEVHFENETTMMMSKNLSQVKLPDNRFYRIHSSVVVNITYIKRLLKDSVILTNDKIFPISQRRRKEFVALLNQYFHNL